MLAAISPAANSIRFIVFPFRLSGGPPATYAARTGALRCGGQVRMILAAPPRSVVGILAKPCAIAGRSGRVLL